jgi:nucleoside-diphosphate-sugar epimerase
MEERYLVTGGAGFIGNHIARALLELGHSVRIFDNFATGHRHNLVDIYDDVDLVEGDLRSIDACRRATQGVTYVLHGAALPSVPRSIEDPHTTHEVNATGTLNLLVASREAGVKRLIYSSSSSVYGQAPKLPREESDRAHPTSPYAVSKLAGEQYCTAFYHSYGLETVALRYFNVFGPRQGWDSPYAAALPRFIRALRRGEPATIYGDGEQRRDFTYVANVVRANVLALEAPDAPGRVYNIGSGHWITVNQLLAATAESLGAKPRCTRGPARPGEIRDSVADIGRARADLGYEPLESIEDGLRKTVAWALGRDD